jgi:DNA-binding beta-propeller fold protein YncE/mono/diheme cytochrome c family protein
VTGVDLGEKKTLWTLDVAREPRAVVVHPDGKRAYISHLTSADLTRIDDVAQASAKSSSIAFPAAPHRAPSGVKSTASLGYALALDDAGNRLFAARHAHSAIGVANWYGSPTVDVLQTENDTPLLGPRVPGNLLKSTPAFDETRQSILQSLGDRAAGDYRLRNLKSPVLADSRISQPRALVVAHKTQMAWIASESLDIVVELPLQTAAPIEAAQRFVLVGSHYKDQKIIVSYDEGGIPGHCGAPTGLALSEDETKLYVFCRSTYDVATVLLTEKEPPVVVARVAQDPLGEDGSRGRRLFYGGRDRESTDDLGCAGCHPEGRDDGHVWHDIYDFPGEERRRPVFFASHMIAEKTKGGKLGFPRQTPMLAGRVNSSGPYGWHAQSETLLDRLAEGFSKHRWWGTEPAPKSWMTGERANALRVFLRKGLATPPRIERALNEEEMRGKKLFESDDTQCAKCHVPTTEFTDRAAYELPKIAPPPGFEEESDGKFKTPSLFFVVGSAPYYHDGHAPTLEALVAQNNDRMGKTNQLSAADKAALVAYLKTL